MGVDDAYVGAIFPLIEQFLAETSGPTEAAAWADAQRGLHERGELSCTQFCFTARRPA